MSKKKKIAAFIIIFVFLLVGTVFLLNTTSYSFVKARAVNYLCDKYDAEKDEFDLVDYKPSKIYIDSSGEIEQHLAFSDFSFEFKYKDKNFFVNRYKGKLYDDYQIDDIEKWCTDWLKENVDENINGIAFDSISIANCLRRTNMTNKHVFTEDDAEKFIINCYPKKGYPTYISYHLDNLKDDENNAIRVNVSQIIKKKLSSDFRFQLGITKMKEMNRRMLKSNSDNWIVRYSVLF